MKILLLSQFFSITRGGGEYIFNLLAKQLGENDHEVWVITNKIIGENYKNLKNVNLVFVPPSLKYQGGLPPSFFDNLRYTIHTIRKGHKLIKQNNIDIIHSNNFAPALAGSILSSITSKPHITSVWDIFTLCGKNYWSKWAEQANVPKINSFLGPKFEKLVLKLNHKTIHTISDASKDDLVRFGAKKPINVIHPAIEESFTNNFEFKPFQFIYIGRLVFYKNLEVVIKAISIVKKEKPEIKLIIIGSGPYENFLKKLVNSLNLQSNIEFKGYVTTDTKIKLIQESIDMVFPSLCEGFGLVILEAFSQNRPVLVSNIRPMSDIVEHEKTGYLLNPYDEKLWANYITRLVKNPQEANLMGKNGKKVLQAKYNPESMYKKIISMYSEVIQNH